MSLGPVEKTGGIARGAIVAARSFLNHAGRVVSSIPSGSQVQNTGID